MNGGVLSPGTPLATAGFSTPIPIISTPQTGLRFSEPIHQQREKMDTSKRERRTKHQRGLRRERRNNRKEFCRMYSSGAGSYLRIHHNGSVDGVKSTNPGELSIIEFIGIAHVIGLVKIRGVQSKNYLCMNEDGNLYAHPQGTEECIFKEHIGDNNYNYYTSKKYNSGGTRFWFVALNKNGTARSAKKSRMDQKFTKFLLNNCKKIKETPGPFSIDQIKRIVPTSVINVKPTVERERQKGRGRKRCKGKRGRRCRKRKNRKNKKGRKNKEDGRTTAQPETNEVRKGKKFRPSDIADPCERKYRNRQLRGDFEGEAQARRRLRRCQRRQRRKERQRLAKLANTTVASPISTTTTNVLSTSSSVVSRSTQNPVTSTAKSVTKLSQPTRVPTESVQLESDRSDLKHSNRPSAALDFRSVFGGIVKAIQINNQELLSNFSTVEEGPVSLASLLRSGSLRQRSGGQSGSSTAGSGATLTGQKHRHHHGENGRRRHEREISADSRVHSETPSGSNRDSETGLSGEQEGTKPSESERTQHSLMQRIFLHTFGRKGSSPERTWPERSVLSLNSDNYRLGIVVIRGKPTKRPSEGRRRGRRKSRRRMRITDKQS